MGRYAFGRSIASFQAIKHKLADMFIAVELARSNCYYGAWALSTDAPELPTAAATARVSASQAYHECSKENIQTHGGMGFTWEFDCHLYYRRCRQLAANIGSQAVWKDKLISSLERANQIQEKNMDFNDTPEEAKFRKEAYDWLKDNAPLKEGPKDSWRASSEEEGLKEVKKWQKNMQWVDMHLEDLLLLFKP